MVLYKLTNSTFAQTKTNEERAQLVRRAGNLPAICKLKLH